MVISHISDTHLCTSNVTVSTSLEGPLLDRICLQPPVWALMRTLIWQLGLGHDAWLIYSENGCSVICFLQVILLWLMLIGLHFVFCLFLTLASAHPSSLRETTVYVLCIWRSLWPKSLITLLFSCIQHQFCFKLVSGRFYQMLPWRRCSLMSKDWDELVRLTTTC